MADAEALPSAEVKQEPAKVVEAEVVAERPKPSLGTWSGIDWTKVPEDARESLQAEMDRRIAAAKANERRRAKKETEAYYKGRESVRPPEPRIAPQQEKPKEAEEAPKRDDFGSYEEYLEARAVHVAEKAAVAAQEKAAKASQERTQREQEVKRANEFKSKVLVKYPDIETRLEAIGDLPIHKGVQDAIAESEFGPELLDSLVSKPEEFERLFKLSEPSAIREIGRMEARYEAAKKPPEPVKKPSTAPEPIKPGGGGSPEDGIPSDKDSIEDWMRKSHALDRKKRM